MAAEPLRYVKIDFQSHKDALLQRIRARWPLLWNDFLFNGQSSFATLLVDIIAWSTATLAFLINRQAGESFISTMTLRESAQRIGSLVGYNLRGPSPAIVQCQAALVAVATSDVTILKDTVIRTNDGLVFEVTKDFVITAGNMTPTTPVVTLSINETGTNVLSTNVSVQNGSAYVDLIDSTIDIADQVEVNQSLQFTVPGLSQVYLITAISSADASGVNNRLVIDPPFDDGTGSTTAQIAECEVFDGRIALVQGQTVSDKFITPNLETSNYAVKLSQTPVIDGSVTVEVNGTDWPVQTSIFNSLATDQACTVRTLTSGITIVQFGNGVFGAIVSTEATVVVRYRVGGGSDGNIARNTINTSISGFVSGFSNPVTILIKNETADGIGGLDAETVDGARSSIPYFIRTNDRAVTVDDYQTIANGFRDNNGSVAFARAATRTENSLLEGNIVVIYAWTRGSGDTLVPLSAPLKSSLKEWMQKKATGTDFVLIADGTEQPAKISLRVKVLQGFDLIETKGFVQKTLRDIITPLRPGSTIVYSDMVRLIDEALGVDNVTMATPNTDLIPSNPTELFTVPREDFTYTIDRAFSSSAVSLVDGSTISTYTAQLPVAPLAVWSARFFLGSFELTAMPDSEPGFARLYRVGVLSVSDDLKSRVNLLTGKATLAIKGVQGVLTMKLVPIQAYDRQRAVNVFVGYTGTAGQAKRREIRAILRSWSDGLKIGGSIYSQAVEGVIVSKANIKDVVLAVPGVTGVTRVALETPSSGDVRVMAAETELLHLGQVTINNSQD